VLGFLGKCSGDFFVTPTLHAYIGFFWDPSFIVGVTEKVAPTIPVSIGAVSASVGATFRHPDTACNYWFLFGVSSLFIVGVTEKVAPTIPGKYRCCFGMCRGDFSSPRHCVLLLVLFLGFFLY
jgi:hypothetical protein